MVLAQAAAGRGGVQPAARPPAAINLWGLSGRQAMMQMRNQMQMRGFHGARFEVGQRPTFTRKTYQEEKHKMHEHDQVKGTKMEYGHRPAQGG